MIISCHLRNKTSLPRLSPKCSQAPPLRRSDVPPSAAHPSQPSARAQHIPCGTRGDPLKDFQVGKSGGWCPTMTNNLAKELQS